MQKQISDAELCLMYTLDDGKPHSQREISMEWLVPKTTLNTITKRWEKDGLILLNPIPGKRREMQITLTESGRKYVKEIMGFIYKAENKTLEKTLER